RCTECYGYDDDEPRCVSVCPVDAILPDPNNAESKEELKYKYESLKEQD
ncbi:YfhL family 4Fe-4S dicluster ferredoxin, partial [Helicobacter pylori]